MDELPTRTLLYRYLFYGWLFKDVNRGNLLERAQAWRHNREQAQFLPTYLRRWAACGLLWFCAGARLEAGSWPEWASATMYVCFVVALSYCVVTFVAWLFLAHDVRLG